MYSYSFSNQRNTFITIITTAFIIMMVAMSGCENSSGADSDDTDTEPIPTIESVEPTSGVVGTEVLIIGSNFGMNLDNVTINFNGTEAEITSLSPEELETTVPEGATTGPVNVVISGQEVSGPTFTVEEPEPRTGDLLVYIETSGEELDDDGYMVSLNTGEELSSAINDTLEFSNLDEGSYDISLIGTADNCNVENGSRKSVTISAGDTALASFSVLCEAPDPNTLNISLKNKIVAVSYSSDFTQKVLVAANPDGTEKVELTKAEDNLFTPDVAPDGESVIFLGSSGIHKLSSSGEEILASGIMPSWSPDGTQIVYLVGDDIYTMSADGSNQKQITSEENTNDVESPAWSPDGERIIFRCDQGFGNGANQLCIVNSDGTDLLVLTNNEYTYRAPAWSPDGSKVAFHGYFDDNSGIKDSKIFVMDEDGSNVVQLTEELGYHPTWSPDGSRIAFQGDINGDRDDEITTALYIVDIDGTNREPIPGVILYGRKGASGTTPSGNGGPDWGPANE